ncbi:hypothetical protein [Paeniglutamicibacter sp. NPDC091659]|uniref:hypothetical protein n=1 Tax=Paeniglutamicibacter sp. NPDC091659 TaxID=3364389 RepID=UPI0037FA4499
MNTLDHIAALLAIGYAIIQIFTVLTYGGRSRTVCNHPTKKKGRCKHPRRRGTQCAARHDDAWITSTYALVVLLVTAAIALALVKPLSLITS